MATDGRFWVATEGLALTAGFEKRLYRVIIFVGCIRAPVGSDAVRELGPKPVIASALLRMEHRTVRFPNKDERDRTFLVASVLSLVLLSVVILMRC